MGGGRCVPLKVPSHGNVDEVEADSCASHAQDLETDELLLALRRQQHQMDALIKTMKTYQNRQVLTGSLTSETVGKLSSATITTTLFTLPANVRSREKWRANDKRASWSF